MVFTALTSLCRAADLGIPNQSILDSTMHSLPVDSAKIGKIATPTDSTKGLDTLKQNTHLTNKNAVVNVPSGAAGQKLNNIVPLGLGNKLKLDTTKFKRQFGSSLSNPVNNLGPKLKMKNKFETILEAFITNNKFHGTVGAGYDYGVVPFVTSGPLPAGYMKIDGNMTMTLFSMPFNISFFYTDIQNVPGITNYFRFAYDQNKFKQDLSDKASGSIQDLKAELTNLYAEKQLVEQKFYYLKTVNSGSQGFALPSNTTFITDSTAKTNQRNTGNLETKLLDRFYDSIPKTTKPNAENGIVSGKDSLSKGDRSDSIPKTAQKPNLTSDPNKITLATKDSTGSYVKASKQQYDSIQKQLSRVEAKLKLYENKIKATIAKIEKLMDPKNALTPSKTSSPTLNKVLEYAKYFKKFELGMCYPSYNTFLVNAVAIKGINFEFQKDNLYFAATYGNTVSSVLATPNIVQNKLYNTQNLFNYFDFNPANNERNIKAFKIGKGKKEGTHFYIGYLSGLGLPSNVSGSTSFSTITPYVVPDKNFVMEVDGRVVIDKISTFDLFYGKSALQTFCQGADVTFSSFIKTTATNALMAKYTINFDKTKTKFTFTGRYIDPFFQSFGIAMMRSDNFRFELKGDQVLNNTMKLSISYKRDEDNLLGIYNYKNLLQTFGTNLSIKLRKSLTMKLGFTPVLQDITTKDNSYSAHNVNSINSAVLTYNPKLRKGSNIFNLMYNYYNLSSPMLSSKFQSLSLSNVAQLSSNLKNNFTAGWFFTSSNDSLSSTYLITDELSCTLKKSIIITGGLKGAFSALHEPDYGYVAKLNFPLSKKLSFEVSFEKLVTGDFYNSLNYSQILAFPYYMHTKLMLSW